MTERLDFRVRPILGEGQAPAWANPDRIAMVAPRPLDGEPAEITPIGWAGEVVIFCDDPVFAARVRSNHRLDADIAVWIDRNELISQTRTRLAADYSPAEVDGLTDDEILSMAKLPETTSIALNT